MKNYREYIQGSLLFEHPPFPTENIDPGTAIHDFTAKSPLRYPGGKTRAVEIIFQYFPKRLETLISPFLGGGSLELYLAARGTKVIGFDVFQPLVEFWQCLTEQPNKLADEVEKHYPLSKEKFYELQDRLPQKSQTTFPTKLERAAIYYVLNRSSFSGATLSGGMSPDHPRFTPSSIERIRHFYNPNLKVCQADFKESLTAYPNAFAYVDPPYLIKSNLYGKKGNAHKDFDHAGLAELLKYRKSWLLSYNDCPEIRDLYQGFSIITPNWKYGMSSDKSSKEVLIFSDDTATKADQSLSKHIMQAAG